MREYSKVKNSAKSLAGNGFCLGLLLLFQFFTPRVYAQEFPEFEFRILSMEATPYVGDIAYVDLAVGNTSLFNTPIEAPRPYYNVRAFWRSGERDSPGAELFVEPQLDPYDFPSTAVKLLRPGQHCSVVAAIRILKLYNAELNKNADGKAFRLDGSSEQSIDIMFSQSLQTFSPVPFQLQLTSQVHRIIYRLPIRDAVIVGDIDMVQRELAKLHNGDQRCVRWGMFPDFANRYAERELLEPESNLARLHEFSLQYNHAAKTHADSPDGFIEAVERIMAHMHPLERRWLVLQMYQDAAVRLPELKKAFFARFEPRRLVVK